MPELHTHWIFLGVSSVQNILHRGGAEDVAGCEEEALKVAVRSGMSAGGCVVYLQSLEVAEEIVCVRTGTVMPLQLHQSGPGTCMLCALKIVRVLIWLLRHQRTKW